MFNFLNRQLLFILCLIFLSFGLFWANYLPGSWLSGWDALHPELNYEAHFERNSSLWLGYRGLGAIDGQAHATNLIHTILVWVFDLFLPSDILRYVVIFLGHLIGGIGLYKLLEFLLPKDKKASIAAFLGALFYQYNLATIQMFFTPFEVFVFHFAFLPWLGLYALKYLLQGKVKNLGIFILISILSLPQAFVPTVFASYLVFLGSIILFNVRLSKLRRILVLIATVFALNAFWLIPYISNLPETGKVIQSAKINQMSSYDVFLKNQARGNLWDVILLRGSMLDVSEFVQHQTRYIMETWRQHTNQIPTIFSIVILFIAGIYGVIKSLGRNNRIKPFVLIFLLCFVLLGSNIPVLKELQNLLRESVPLFNEAFRFPFTKFSTLYSLALSVFLGLGIFNLLSLRIFASIWKQTLLIIFFLASLSYLAYPSFTGNFLFNSLKVEFPKEYFETFEYFKNQNKSDRVAYLPQPQFWSWRFNDWEYRGSGVLWYGLSQPLLDRAHDPWSRENENYYWEISQAIYAEDVDKIRRVFEKYNVSYIIVDETVVNPSSPKALYTEEILNLLNSSPVFNLEKDLGQVKIYSLSTVQRKEITAKVDLPVVSPTYQRNDNDTAYYLFGDYLTGKINSTRSVYFPFRSLFTSYKPENQEFTIEESDTEYTLKSKLPQEFKAQPQTQEIIDEELPFVDPNNILNAGLLTKKINITNDSIEIVFPKAEGLYSFSIDPVAQDKTSVHLSEVTSTCNLEKADVKNQIVESQGNKFLRLYAKNSNNCSQTFSFDNLSHKYPYLISIKSRNKSGKPLLVWWENLNIRRADFEVYLPKQDEWTTSYFIQPPMEQDGLGYSLHIENISHGDQESVNDLSEITVYPLPYTFLSNLYLIREFPETKPGSVEQLDYRKINSGLYQVKFKGETANIILSQSYHPGWKAFISDDILFPFSGQKMNQVLVNNWANGWTVNSEGEKNIVIVFLPQYLQYLGFIFGIIFISSVILWRKRI